MGQAIRSVGHSVVSEALALVHTHTHTHARATAVNIGPGNSARPLLV